MVGPGGDVGIINVEEAVCSFHMGMGLFQRAPSSSPINGGHIPSHFNNIQREEEHQRSRIATPFQWS
jgi:hypothetical protein